ncbi:hypothetical protein CU098_003061, partial [Rhizopus stolonifer]
LVTILPNEFHGALGDHADSDDGWGTDSDEEKTKKRKKAQKKNKAEKKKTIKTSAFFADM